MTLSALFFAETTPENHTLDPSTGQAAADLGYGERPHVAYSRPRYCGLYPGYAQLPTGASALLVRCTRGRYIYIDVGLSRDSTIDVFKLYTLFVVLCISACEKRSTCLDPQRPRDAARLMRRGEGGSRPALPGEAMRIRLKI